MISRFKSPSQMLPPPVTSKLCPAAGWRRCLRVSQSRLLARPDPLCQVGWTLHCRHTVLTRSAFVCSQSSEKGLVSFSISSFSSYLFLFREPVRVLFILFYCTRVEWWRLCEGFGNDFPCWNASLAALIYFNFTCWFDDSFFQVKRVFFRWLLWVPFQWLICVCVFFYLGLEWFKTSLLLLWVGLAKIGLTYKFIKYWLKIIWFLRTTFFLGRQFRSINFLLHRQTKANNPL